MPKSPTHKRKKIELELVEIHKPKIKCDVHGVQDLVPFGGNGGSICKVCLERPLDSIFSPPHPKRV